MADFKVNRKFDPRAWIKVIKIDQEVVKTVVFRYALFLAIFLIVFYSAFYKLQERKVYNRPDQASESQFAIIPVAEVSDNENGTKLIEDRAEIAAELYRQGIVQRIFISGRSDSSDSINRINIAKNVLQIENIPDFIVVEEDISSSTYETCYRAKTQDGINQAIIVTQEYHMPRALYVCSSLGIEVQGVLSDRSIYTDIRNLSLQERIKIISDIIDVIILRPEY